MKIGLVSDSLAHLPLGEMLATAARLGVQGIEFNTGNWSTAPHLSLATLVSNQAARDDFAGEVARHGLEIIAFNCNGNQLHPVEGAEHDQIVRDTVKLAGLMGFDKIVLMSGLPGGGEQERCPNWIVSSWPPENERILAWQWEERLFPYWRELVRFGADHGVTRFAIEMHGNQLVYSPRTLLALRHAIGPEICANLDPSHLMWMGADPIAAIDHLGPAIQHVHGKDTLLNTPVQATASLLENGPLDNVSRRSWSHCTLGYGHDLKWWQDFCYRLRMAGYDGWLSIEHEDVNLSREEGVRKAISLLQQAGMVEPPDYAVQDI